MTRSKKKTFLLISDIHRIAIEGKPTAHTNDHFLVVKGKKKAYVDKVEYLKMMN